MESGVEVIEKEREGKKQLVPIRFFPRIFLQNLLEGHSGTFGTCI